MTSSFKSSENETVKLMCEKLKILLTMTDLQSDLLESTDSGPGGRLGKVVQVPRQHRNGIF